MTKEEFLEKIFSNNNSSVVGSFVSSVTDKEGINSISLSTILNLDTNRFSKEGKIIIDILESDEDFPYRDLYQSLKWKISSLINIQDAFSGIVFEDYTHEVFSSKSYFYYEGLHLLREYFYCGFNNYLSAAQHILRTFIEFNIKQNYFDFICKQQNSFKPLKKYLKDGISPSSIKMANTFLPDGSFAKPIKKKIQLILANLSNTSSHAYKPIDSMRGNGKLQHEYSMDTMLFWLSLNHTINIVLWSYYINYPILFNPKDIPKKFGFSHPMGIFISEFQYESIKNSLSEEDFKLFKEYALNTDEVKSLNEFYNEQKDLSDEEITSTWDEEKPLKDIKTGYIQLTAKYRAMNEILASTCTFDAQKNIDKSLEPLIRQVGDYSWWKKNYKKM